MGLFGGGRSDDRRRRVLTEEVIGTGARTPKSAPEVGERAATSEARRNRYGEAARMERQTRISDLIPKSYGVTALWFVLGLGLIAGIEALHFYMPLLAVHTPDQRIAAFSLDGEGNLGAALSSFLLLLASGAALVVYSIRKHRADDYHARYRIWFVAAVSWFVLALDESAGLHEDFKVFVGYLAGEVGYGDGALYWIGAYAIVLGIVGLQLVLDMKECRTSTFFFVLTAACYTAAVVAHLNLLLPAELGIDGVMVEEGLELVGNLLLLTSMSLHARYVTLVAEGEITPRGAKVKKDKPKSKRGAAAEAKAEETKPSGFGWFRRAKIDPPHRTPAPAGKTTDLEPVSRSERSSGSSHRATTETLDVAAQNARGSVKKVAADFSEDDEDDRRDNRKLSKADRKAMRKQKDMERRYGSDDE
jgi:hypothetical protein